MQLLPDEVALQPPTERDYQELGGPLGAGRVFQEDQARHCAAEIPGKTHNLNQTKGKGEDVRERRYAPRRTNNASARAERRTGQERQRTTDEKGNVLIKVGYVCRKGGSFTLRFFCQFSSCTRTSRKGAADSTDT